MKITAVFHVKGRGTIAMVTDLPKSPVLVGTFLHQGKRAWKIVGIESSCGLFRRHEVGVILSGEGDPDIGPIDL